MKDAALRASIMIVAEGYLSRKDLAGTEVHKLLKMILDGAETMDQVMEKRERKGLSIKTRKTK